MSVPFYDRTTAVCPGCKRRQHHDVYRKWLDGRFGQHALCVTCEPSVKPEHPERSELRKERDFLAEKAERFAKPKKLVPMATCPGCERLLKLHLFRKWWGTKRIKRTLCVDCEPERGLEDLKPAERAAMVDLGRARATPTRVASLNEADAQAQRQRRATGAKRRHSMARTQAWSPTLRVLRGERAWCRKNLITPASTEWRAFFEAYETALNAALQLAGIKKRNSTSTTEVPAPETFLYPETRQSLRRLYASCPVVRGRRLYRDPLCLSW